MDQIPVSLLTRRNLDAICAIHKSGLVVEDLSPDVQVLWDVVQQHQTCNPEPVTQDTNLHRWIVLDILTSLHIAPGLAVPECEPAMDWVLHLTQPPQPMAAQHYSIASAISPQKSLRNACQVAGNVGSRIYMRPVWEAECKQRCDLLCSIGHLLPAPTHWHNIS